MIRKNLFKFLRYSAVVILGLVSLSCTRGVKINGIVWMKDNVGATKEKPWGELYDFYSANDACPRGWRLPTADEWKTLVLNGSESSIHNGVSGSWFSGSRTYSKDIPAVFLPTGGRMDEDKELEYRGGVGFFWSSTPGTDRESYVCLQFGLYGYGAETYECDRSEGLSVRCVKK